MKRSSPELKLCDLEQRDVPSTVGFDTDSFDARNLTLSFAPEKTLIDGVPSKSLGHFGSSKLGTSESQMAFLRAVQAYVTVTNINVGLVADSGEPLGISGEMQGDSRFGDIRITARPLGNAVLATAVPFNWAVGTWSGDIIVNSKADFVLGHDASRPDLYTVALHELGHIFGLDHSDDPDSVMTERFNVAKQGLAPSDIAEVQSLFGGPRRMDPFEGASGNQTLATATELGSSGNRRIMADLNDQDRVDTYTFTVPRGSDKARVDLQTSGLSLLTSRLEVLDSRGNLVRSQSSLDPTRGDLEIRLSGLKGGEQFFIRVSANAETGFGVGRYQLRLEYRNEKGNLSVFEQDGGDNDALATASELNSEAVWSRMSSRDRYVYHAAIERRTDVDYYRLTTPSNITGSNSTLMIQLRIFNDKQALPTLQVVDRHHNPITAHLVSNSGEIAVYQVLDITRFQDLYLIVSGNGPNQTGNYRLNAEFTQPIAANFQVLQRGALSRDYRTASASLQINQPGLYQFVLNTNSLQQGVTGQLTMQIVNERGHPVASMTHVLSNGPVTLTTYLLTGSYQVTYSLSLSKNSSATVTFWLDGGLFSDPIGPRITSVNTTPISTTGTSGTSGTTATTDTTGGPTSPPPLPPYVYQPALTITLGSLFPIYGF